jgi:hypothetical protein
MPTTSSPDRRPGKRFAVRRHRAMKLALVFIPPWTIALLIAASIVTLHDQGAGDEHLLAHAQDRHQPGPDAP